MNRQELAISLRALVDHAGDCSADNRIAEILDAVRPLTFLQRIRNAFGFSRRLAYACVDRRMLEDALDEYEITAMAFAQAVATADDYPSKEAEAELNEIEDELNADRDEIIHLFEAK